MMTPCVLWEGKGVDHHGYAHIHVPGRGDQLAHRIAYETARGPIPEGLELDHLCRVPLCVNPYHLEAVTHRENMRRGMTPWALAKRTGFCARGIHARTDWNTYRRKGGTVECRRCHADRERERQRRLRAAP